MASKNGALSVMVGGYAGAGGSFEASAGAKLGIDGAEVKLSASAGASVHAGSLNKINLGDLTIKDEVRGYAVAKVEAAAQGTLDKNGIVFKGSAFAASAVGIEQTRSFEIAGISVTGTAGAYTGQLGASASIELSL